jgi:hypothetical protein
VPLCALPALLCARGCDLGLDLGYRSAQRGAADSRHGGIEHFGLCSRTTAQQLDAADLDRTGDRAERRVGLIHVGQVQQRADQESGRPADEHSEQSADDPQQRADQTSAGRGRRER